jgi:hypothetical protein
MWAAILLIIILGLAVFIPVYRRSTTRGPRQDACLSNLHALSAAMRMYVQDSGRFPDAVSWMEALRPYLARKDPFHCPDDKEHAYSYAMNSMLDGKKLSEASKSAVAIFDWPSNRPNAHAPIRSLSDLLHYPASGGRDDHRVAHVNGDDELVAMRPLRESVGDP